MQEKVANIFKLTFSLHFQRKVKKTPNLSSGDENAKLLLEISESIIERLVI